MSGQWGQPKDLLNYKSVQNDYTVHAKYTEIFFSTDLSKEILVRPQNSQMEENNVLPRFG